MKLRQSLVFSLVYSDYISSSCLWTNIVRRLYVHVPTYLLFSLLYCAVIRLSHTAHLSLWIGTAVRLTDESFPLSGDSLSEEVQISAHPRAGNHAWHLDERRALVTWLTGTLTWGDGCEHHRHRNIKTAGVQLHAWHTGKRLDTQNESLHIKSSSSSFSSVLNNVTGWYP